MKQVEMKIGEPCVLCDEGGIRLLLYLMHGKYVDWESDSVIGGAGCVLTDSPVVLKLESEAKK